VDLKRFLLNSCWGLTFLDKSLQYATVLLLVWTANTRDDEVNLTNCIIICITLFENMYACTLIQVI